MRTNNKSGWEFEVFFDGECPLCTQEISVLRWMDRKENVLFTDISAPEFDATSMGLSQEEFMSSIRGRDCEGQWYEGVEVFRKLYEAVGLTWIVFPTRLPGISHLLDAGYSVFARNRLRLTGRCTDQSCSLGESHV